MKKIIVIGGGAGGGSFAAKIRRFDNNASIKIYERSPFVSYSNCGQPYLISGEKPTFDSIIVYSVKDWKEQYNVDAFSSHEVIAINRKTKMVTIKNLLTGKEFKDKYDKLMIAPGTSAIMPPIPGAKEANNIHVLKTPDQLKKIMKGLNQGAKKAVVIGAGFIGLEIAENCKIRGMDVHIIDASPRLLFKVLDEDFSVFVNKAMIEKGINLKLGSGVSKIENNGKTVVLNSGEKITTDIIFMVVGTKTETKMYEDADLKIGATRGVIVNKSSQTNDPDIYATGDVAETVDWKGKPSRIQLAIIAQRLSTIAANHIYGIIDKFMGVQNTASLSVFNTTVAAVGYTEAYLKKQKIKYNKTLGIEQHAVLHSENIFLKVLYDDEGMILGAQAAGPNSAEKRINYAAMAMMYNIPVEELLHFQTAYNPVVDTQRDPINLIARIARAQNAGIIKNTTVSEMDEYLAKGYKLLDVRTKAEWDEGHHKDAVLFPLQVLTEKMSTLDKNEKYLIYCRRGARAYNFQLRLKNAGFKNVVNILGAWDHMETYEKYKFKD